MDKSQTLLKGPKSKANEKGIKKIKERAKTRKGKWKKSEHKLFINGIVSYGGNWKKLRDLLKTRTVSQIRSHAQKFLLRLRGNYLFKSCNPSSMKHFLKNISKLNESKKKEIILELSQIPFHSSFRGGSTYKNFNKQKKLKIENNINITLNYARENLMKDICKTINMELLPPPRYIRNDYYYECLDRVNENDGKLIELISKTISKIVNASSKNREVDEGKKEQWDEQNLDINKFRSANQEGKNCGSKDYNEETSKKEIQQTKENEGKCKVGHEQFFDGGCEQINKFLNDSLIHGKENNGSYKQINGYKNLNMMDIVKENIIRINENKMIIDSQNKQLDQKKINVQRKSTEGENEKINNFITDNTKEGKENKIGEGENTIWFRHNNNHKRKDTLGKDDSFDGGCEQINIFLNQSLIDDKENKIIANELNELAESKTKQFEQRGLNYKQNYFNGRHEQINNYLNNISMDIENEINSKPKNTDNENLFKESKEDQRINQNENYGPIQEYCYEQRALDNYLQFFNPLLEYIKRKLIDFLAFHKRNCIEDPFTLLQSFNYFLSVSRSKLNNNSEKEKSLKVNNSNQETSKEVNIDPSNDIQDRNNFFNYFHYLTEQIAYKNVEMISQMNSRV